MSKRLAGTDHGAWNRNALFSSTKGFGENVNVERYLHEFFCLTKCMNNFCYTDGVELVLVAQPLHSKGKLCHLLWSHP